MCPRCHEPMMILELRGVEVDHCLGCRGTWFDAGELSLVAEQAGRGAERLEAAQAAAGARTRGRARCPRCGRRMRVVHLPGTRPVEVDACPGGDGIWLDRGELAAIVREYAEADCAAVARFLGDLLQDELATGEQEKRAWEP